MVNAPLCLLAEETQFVKQLKGKYKVGICFSNILEYIFTITALALPKTDSYGSMSNYSML